MTGLKNIENQRAFEKLQLEAQSEPAYKLLEEVFTHGYISNLPGASALRERVRIYLTTGILEA